MPCQRVAKMMRVAPNHQSIQVLLPGTRVGTLRWEEVVLGDYKVVVVG